MSLRTCTPYLTYSLHLTLFGEHVICNLRLTVCKSNKGCRYVCLASIADRNYKFLAFEDDFGTALTSEKKHYLPCPQLKEKSLMQ